MSEKNAMTLMNMALTVIYQRVACCSLAAAALSSCFSLPAAADLPDKGSPSFLPLEERWELGRRGQFKPVFKGALSYYPNNGYQGTFILRDGRRQKFRIRVKDSPLDQRVVQYGTGLSIKSSTFNCLSSKQRDWVRSKVLIKAAWLTGCHGKVASYSSQPVKYGRDPLRNPQVVDFVGNMAEIMTGIVSPQRKKCPPGYYRPRGPYPWLHYPCMKRYQGPTYSPAGTGVRG